ncbi:hypothetical protein EGK_04397 [Macaca mulatta]|uniref:ATP synthase peripheral stalk subunit OSCP, mitochondrial n=1 Tax=Macaca mulatta TaxID=9544 RepID=G7N809_MACMU|nr:hypothetical protein EGK_04397 [Macaca mulatta]
MAAPAVSGLSRQVRCFNTSVVRPFAKLVRPPVQVYSIEGRYATALYSAASKQMAASVLNHYVKRSVRVKSLKDITAKERFSPVTTNWINVLAENGRLSNTQGVVSAFFTMMSVHRGEVPCTVTTASPLEEAILSELKTVLKSFVSQGQVLKLEAKTDLSITGGMTVRIGEKYVGTSVKTKIQKLGRAMREVV